MSKPGVNQEEEKKKDEEEGQGSADNNTPPVPEVLTRLTRNRLLQHQRQKASSSDDPKKSGNTDTIVKTKPQEKDGPSSSSLLDNEKEGNNAQQPEPHEAIQKETATIMRPRRAAKEKKTIIKDSKDDKNGISEKNVIAMKTRSTRSCNQPAVKIMSATNQQNKAKKEGDENAKNLTKKKKTINSSSYRRSKRMYDEAGALLANGKDYCDCLEVDCPGCHFPCKKCGSEKCGTECRCDRTWVYDEVKVEGTGIIIKNHACSRSQS